MKERETTCEPRCLWIEPNGTTHRFFNGQHAITVQRNAPEIAKGAVIMSEVSERAFRAGWLLVVWMAFESYPYPCVVLDRSGTGIIPGPQMDAWLAWCEQMGVRPSCLEVLSLSNPKAAIWGG